VSIVGSDKLMRKGSWYILPGAIHVSVRPVIETRDLEREDIEGLLNRVRSEISAGLSDPPRNSKRRLP
jgi:hypothetical protein